MLPVMPSMYCPVYIGQTTVVSLMLKISQADCQEHRLLPHLERLQTPIPGNPKEDATVLQELITECLNLLKQVLPDLHAKDVTYNI